MARDINTHRGFGATVLKEAIKKALVRGSFYALEVVAKNNALAKYYMSYGFIPFLDDDTHLFLPRETIHRLIK